MGFGTPFAEQIDFLRRKLNLPTDRWDDIQGAAHDRAFIVAGAAQADLLQDLRDAVAGAAQSGEGLGGFTKRFKAVVAKNGWTGWTGEGSAAGTAWRARVIYQTNMATSYAAGRWRQMTDPAMLAIRPWWQYVHADGQLHPRPQHEAWNGLTLRHDHPFIATHWTPNGWGCRCEWRPVKAPPAGAATVPPPGWDAVDQTTGAPVGIDRGFGHAPGANATTPLQRLVDDKLLRLDAPIGAAMARALAPALAMERRLQWTDMVDAVASAMQADGATVLATTVAPDLVGALADAGVVLDNAAVWLRDHDLLHALRASKASRGAALPTRVWRDLPQLLDAAPAWLDTQDTALLYAIDAGAGLGKVVVRVNYNAKGRFDGMRERIVSNFIQTGGLIDADNLAGDGRYLALVAKR